MVPLEAQNSFPLPEVPPELTQPKERANYIILHFWDNADFSNCGEQNEYLEQSFVDYISVFPHADINAWSGAISELFSRICDTDKVIFIMDLADKYLYSFDSPMRDDALYEIFANHFISLPQIDNSLKARAEYRLETIINNKQGSKANDFVFETRTGDKMSLYDFKNINDMFLIFYDPECDHCQILINELKNNSDFRKKNQAGLFDVLAIYSGEQKDLWLKTTDTLPSEWTVGYDDGTLQEEDLYFLRNLPTIFHIDNNKTVKGKEITLNDIKKFIETLN